MIWSGEGRYHTETPEIFWSDDQGNILGEGYLFEPPYEQDLRLDVVLGNGVELGAMVYLTPAPSMPDVVLSTYPFDVEQIDRSQRLRAETQPLNEELLQPDWTWRIELHTDLSTRWMAPYPSGEILELTKQSTDVLPQLLHFEDNEVVSSESASREGVLALVLDESGGNRWTWIDAPSESSVKINNRYIPTDSVPMWSSSERWTAVVTAQSTTRGFSLNEWLPLPEAVAEGPDCFGEELALKLSWIEGGRCSLSDLNGARVEVLR